MSSVPDDLRGREYEQKPSCFIQKEEIYVNNAFSPVIGFHDQVVIDRNINVEYAEDHIRFRRDTVRERKG
jgi:hypothetical protein